MKISSPNAESASTDGSALFKDRRGDRLLRMKAVIAKTGLTISGIYRREVAGRFPKRLKLGARAVAWYESDIDSFIADPLGYRWPNGATSAQAPSAPR